MCVRDPRQDQISLKFYLPIMSLGYTKYCSSNTWEKVGKNDLKLAKWTNMLMVISQGTEIEVYGCISTVVEVGKL